MFVSRPESKLPSFSELMSSINRYPYPEPFSYVTYGHSQVSAQHYSRTFEGIETNSIVLLPRLDLAMSSPTSGPVSSPLDSVHMADMSGHSLSTSSNSGSGSECDSSTSSPGPILSASMISTSRRKHACTVCGRCFTTSGHLARHNRTHTGERKHVCPYPSCEARFARQDNCMQHYKTHINGRGRRKNRPISVPEKIA